MFPNSISWFGIEKLNLTQQKHTLNNQKKCTTTQNKHKKTKARFSCVLRHPACKQRGPILVSALHKSVTYSLTQTLTHLLTAARLTTQGPIISRFLSFAVHNLNISITAATASYMALPSYYGRHASRQWQTLMMCTYSQVVQKYDQGEVENYACIQKQVVLMSEKNHRNQLKFTTAIEDCMRALSATVY